MDTVPPDREWYTGSFEYEGFVFKCYAVERGKHHRGNGRLVATKEELRILENKVNGMLRFSRSEERKKVQASVMNLLRLYSRIATLGSQGYTAARRHEFEVLGFVADRDHKAMVYEASSKITLQDLIAENEERKKITFHDDIDEVDCSDRDSPGPSEKKAEKFDNLTPQIEERKPNELLEEPRSSILNAPSVIEHFTTEESNAVVRFVLDEIRSKSEGREGRVAKRKVDPKSMHFWARFTLQCENAWRKPVSYSDHFCRCINHLHENVYLTMEEKVDLYYSLDVPVHKSLRTAFEQLFDVEYDKEGVITGSRSLDHWDPVHPESDREQQPPTYIPPVYFGSSRSSRSKSREFRTLKRFTEKEDGMMWKFVLDGVKNGDGDMPKIRFWQKFQKSIKTNKEIPVRSADVFRTRFDRILAPNLHRMPFDSMTKAALYQSLKLPVPEEYRVKIMEETGVQLSDNGEVLENKYRPLSLVLQSYPFESGTIGIQSSTRFSKLKRPSKYNDTIPYSEAENMRIWEYLLEKHRDERGKCIRYVGKATGYKLWQHYVADMKTQRNWQSLSRHFSEYLTKNILSTSFDIITKLELYYIFNIPVDKQALKRFDAICTLICRNHKGCIRYALGLDFEFGKKSLTTTVGPQYSSEEDDEEKEGAADFDKLIHNRNSVKHPYIALGHDYIHTLKKRKTISSWKRTMMAVGDDEPRSKREKAEDVGECEGAQTLLKEMKQEEPMDLELEMLKEPKLEDPLQSEVVSTAAAPETNPKHQTLIEAVKVLSQNRDHSKDHEYRPRASRYVYPKQIDPNVAPTDLFEMIQKTFGEDTKASSSSSTSISPNGIYKVVMPEESAYSKHTKMRQLTEKTFEGRSAGPQIPLTSSAPPSEACVRYVIPLPNMEPPTKRIDAAFDQMEDHVREFCRKLRLACGTMTASQKHHYAERTEHLLRIYNITTRDLFITPANPSEQKGQEGANTLLQP
ncbi:unnamed protein product [Caenorhabditis sp. 36 PRJEB53466]|nr:unnamed protein product [Caenorhabditis sp. 36 PRJEB53466]